MAKIKILFLVALTFFLFAASYRPLAAQVFHDDFDGPGIDSTRWNLDPGGGSVIVSEGRATLAAPCGTQFPYLTSKDNPFPLSGDFLIRVGFRYPDVQWGGNGFGYDYVQRGFGVWQDACCGPLRVAIGDNYPIYPPGLASPDTSYHVYEWRCLSGTYYLYLDGNLIGSNESQFRPTKIFFGHPPTSYCPWTTQEIDFVDIEAIGVTVVQQSTWGRLKSRYK